jgi:hypothetical protein
MHRRSFPFSQANIRRPPHVLVLRIKPHARARHEPQYAFRLLECPSEHGHFISFFDFLKEKDFIRPLSLAEIQNLRVSVAEVHCSNCGGSVNLQLNSACPYCHSPISILDLPGQQQMLAQLKEATETKPVDTALPLKLAMTKAEASNYFYVEHYSQWWVDGRAGDLVQAGLNAVSRLLSKLST